MTALAVFVSIGSPDHVRGYLDRYAVEVVPGVWAAGMTPRLRDQVWNILEKHEGRALLVYHDRASVTGYSIRTNDAYTRIGDLDGLSVVIRASPEASPADTSLQ